MSLSVLRDVEVKETGFGICLELLIRGRCQRAVEVPHVLVNR